LGQTTQVRWYCGACPEERRDGLGSVLADVSSTGTITGARQADVYGAPRATQGAPTSKHAYVGGLGHPTEDDTGLIYMRARWMDPVTGTFVSEDRKRDGANWFMYVGAGPTGNVDANGNTLVALPIGSMDDLVAETESAVQGTALRGQVERLVFFLQEKMELAQAVFEGAFHDTRGGQLVWRYANQFGKTTLRFDIKGGAIDLDGFARNALNTTGVGHSWRFAQVLADIAAAGW
jgi:RHS repeat-associated protein